MNTELMFSSKTDLHSTPQEFYDKLNEEFCFDYDPCATHENAKRAYYSTLEGTFRRFGVLGPTLISLDDGLEYDWSGKFVYMNPPYGRGIGAWVKKACESDCPVKVALLPARTDTRWWWTYIQGIADEIRFVEGRLKFGDATNSAPFPSVVVVWRGAKHARPERKK